MCLFQTIIYLLMAPSFECVGSSLFCAEDDSSFLGLFDEHSDEEMIKQHHQNQCLVVDFLLDSAVPSDECLSLMIEKECQHIPKEDYWIRMQMGALDSSLRRAAIDWIWKVHSYYRFGPVSAYLSVNYLDRFLSAYELPEGKSWMMQLLSVACLSLAAKMEETVAPLSLDLQVCESKFVFEARTIQRMELLVLNTLKWRMQAVTPFSFIDYYLHKINEGKPPARSSIYQAIELILEITKGVGFLEFRPSEVAAAVAITVSEETKTVDFNEAVSWCTHVQKERVVRCCELIQEMVMVRNGPVKISGPGSFVPQSPVGVLDAASCLSYKSTDDVTVASCGNSHASAHAKRRKINR